jgi:hypothetical protein
MTYAIKALRFDLPIFGSASASSQSTKEAANPKAMTFTLFSSKRFPNCRSGWRSGNLHRLS